MRLNGEDLGLDKPREIQETKIIMGELKEIQEVLDRIEKKDKTD